MTGIKHKEKCQMCGKSATVNYQLVWVRWVIFKDGSFSREPDFKNVDTNEWYCDRCYAKEINMWDEEDLDRAFPLEESDDKPDLTFGSGSINDQFEFNR